MPSVRPGNAHAYSARPCQRSSRRRAVIACAAGQGRAGELISSLLKDRPLPDEDEARCFDLIRRFHR